MRVIIKSICFIFCVLFFNACAVMKGYDNSNYQKKVLLDKDSCAMLATFDEKNDLVYNGSYYGLLARTCKDYKLSISIFDKVEDSYKYNEDLEGTASKAGKAVATFFVNDTIKDYQSYDFERSMINIYKALNFIALKDYDSANAELNRALKRDDLLGEKLVLLNQEAKKQIKAQTSDITDNTDEIIKNLSDGLSKYKMYKNNINPFGKYLRSVFYIMDDEPNKASDLLRELMVEYNGENEVIKDDYLLAESKAKSIKNNEKYIWLIYENGLSPTITTAYVPYTYSKAVIAGGVAASIYTDSSVPAFVAMMNNTNVLSMPNMQEGESSFEYLSINGKKTKTVSNMNIVVANELKGKLTWTVYKTIFSNTTKDLLTLGAGMAGGYVAMMAADIYKQTVNTADTRMFIGLPNSFDVARVKNNGSVVIKDEDNEVILSENINKDKNTIVYVKSHDKDNIVFYIMQK